MAPLPRTIIGHAKQVQQLLNDIACDNVAHAYLFSGAQNVGKFPVAKWFAWQLLSQEMSEENAEKVKEDIERLRHPDVLCLDQLWRDGKNDNWEHIAQYSNVPQQHRAKNKAKGDTISIDDIRALQHRLHETASSRYICCLIRSVERMQDAAANALLKILEEPPQRVVFLLTTERPHALLPTVVSRSRVLLFHPVPRTELLPLVSHLSDDEASFILHLSQGAPGSAMRLARDPELLRREKQLHAQARRFWQSSLAERMQWLSEYQAASAEFEPILLHLALSLREAEPQAKMPERHKAFAKLVSGARTNVHRGLLLQQFALAVSR